MSTELEEIANLMNKANKIVVMTGAGMSTPSGLKDFRGKGGMWEDQSVYDIANAHSIRSRGLDETKSDYINRINTFTRFYQMRVKEVLSHKPNAGHKILAKWEYMGLINGIITQNTDGYHQQEGSTTLPIHGNLLDLRCTSCSHKATPFVYAFDINPRCEICNGIIRPDVVLFDEDLPDIFGTALAWAVRSDFMLVLGSSLMVRPANRLPAITIEHYGKVGIISHKYKQQGAFATVVVRDQDVVEALEFLSGRIYKSNRGI